MTWVDLKENEEYEILNEYPYTIRKKSNERVVKVSKNAGVICCYINRKLYPLHLLIARNFIPNPEEMPVVDFANGDRDDYHIENLRWAYQRSSRRDKFIDIPEGEGEPIEYIGDWQFSRYYIYGDDIVKFNGYKYKVLNKLPAGKQWKVVMTDVEGKTRVVTLKKLRRYYGEIKEEPKEEISEEASEGKTEEVSEEDKGEISHEIINEEVNEEELIEEASEEDHQFSNSDA